MAGRIYNRIYGIVQNSWAVIIIIASALIPESSIHHAPVICLFRIVTGYRCPGCGMTHSFIEFFHGRFSEVLSYNILSAVVIPFIITMAIIQAYKLLKNNLFYSHNFTPTKNECE